MKFRLDEAQTRIKIAGKHINSLRYANDTTLMAESEEELKQVKLLSRVRFFATPWVEEPGRLLRPRDFPGKKRN